MQQASRLKKAAKTARTSVQAIAPRKPAAAPQPLDQKSLERVGGGLVELPHKYW
ncbi:MAG: hypothetical protein ABIO45_07240 [Burkholderiaceae bacterium]